MASRLMAVTPFAASVLGELRIDERLQESDDGLSLAKSRDFGSGMASRP